MRTEDGYIIYKCLDGDPAAFGFLVDKYKGSVYAFAYSKLRNFHDAEDITQEVFIKAYRKLHTLRRWDNFHAWLYSITSNLCKMWIRTQARRPDREFVEDRDPQTLEHIPADSYREESVLKAVHEALDSLPDIHRQVLTLHYLGGMKIMEVARFLGTSPSTIARRLRTARAELRKEMLATMNKTYGQHRLQAVFTLRIVEAVKHIRIHPLPRPAELPWGLSLAAGIVLAILSFGSHPSLLNPVDAEIGSNPPIETNIMEVGEFPVEMLDASQVPIISGNQDDVHAGGPRIVGAQDSLLSASAGEARVFSQEPAARLGKGSVNRAVYSPDGRLLAVSGSMGIWLYNTANLEEVGLLDGDTGPIYAIAFSPDGRILASGSGSKDKAIHLWDVQKQEQIGLLEGHKYTVRIVAFSPDGRILASSTGDRYDGAIYLWDVQEKKQIGLLQGHTNSVMCMAFSPDGEILASGGNDSTTRLWDVREKKQIGLLQGHVGLYDSSDSRWERAPERPKANDEPFNQVYSLAFSPDGRTLASGISYKAILLWDVRKQEQIGKLEGHIDTVFTLDFSPDGKTLASGAIGGDYTIRLWDISEQKQLAVLEGHRGWVYSVDFSPDGRTLASASVDATVRFWDVQRQKQKASLQGHTSATASTTFSPDGKLLAAGGDDFAIRLWDIEKQEQVGLLTGHRHAVTCVAFSPDGKTLASSGSNLDKTIRLWNVREQKEIGVLDQHRSSIESISFSPDGKLLASASGNDHSVRLWDVQDQRQIYLFKTDSPENNSGSVAFSPDGKLLAIGFISGITRLWNIETREYVGLLQGPRQRVSAVTFSPDGKLLATEGKGEEIRIWDVREQKQVGMLEGHSVDFTPNGKLMASVSADGAIRFWDVRGLKPLGSLQVRGGVYSITFSSDGKWLAGTNKDGTVSLWRMSPESGEPMDPGQRSS